QVLCTINISCLLVSSGMMDCMELRACGLKWLISIPKYSYNSINCPSLLRKNLFSSSHSWLWILSRLLWSSQYFFISLNNSFDTEYGACGVMEQDCGLNS